MARYKVEPKWCVINMDDGDCIGMFDYPEDAMDLCDYENGVEEECMTEFEFARMVENWRTLYD